jgi:membrane protein YdbS with pleckstrin-like domain
MANIYNTSSSGGIGFVGLLTLMFIGFKLLHVIDWSWWWILSPIWISLSLALIIFLAVIIVLLVVK